MKIPEFFKFTPTDLDFSTEHLGGLWDEIAFEYITIFIPKADHSVCGVVHIIRKTSMDYLKSFYPEGEGPGAATLRLFPKKVYSLDRSNEVLASLESPYRIGEVPGDWQNWKDLELPGFGNTGCRSLSKVSRKTGITYSYTAHKSDGLISAEMVDRQVAKRNRLSDSG